MPRKHANKQCFLCEQRLTHVAKHGCAAIWGRDQCWWEPTIRKHGLDEAVRMSSEMKAGRAALRQEEASR